MNVESMNHLLPALIPLLVGWISDFCWGDPASLPHPIVFFGRCIAWGERWLNRGRRRRLRGAVLALALVTLTYGCTYLLLQTFRGVNLWLGIGVESLGIFFCLAGTTLIREVKQVFVAIERSTDEGRRQVARIVGRDTTELSPQEVRTAALETLAENLNDGFVAPVFWYVLLGLPGMMAYKMVNTLDSMLGYRNHRYLRFGCASARLDDLLGYLPARITAILMILAAGRPNLWSFVWRYGKAHASPNSGYPEAALAGVLDCRFGGGHYYFGRWVDKPYIGTHDRPLTLQDMHVAIRINRVVEYMVIGLSVLTIGMKLLC